MYTAAEAKDFGYFTSVTAIQDVKPAISSGAVAPILVADILENVDAAQEAFKSLAAFAGQSPAAAIQPTALYDMCTYNRMSIFKWRRCLSKQKSRS